jgi:hypothetical protein
MVIGEQWLSCEKVSRRDAGAPRGKSGQVIVRTHVRKQGNSFRVLEGMSGVLKFYLCFSVYSASIFLRKFVLDQGLELKPNPE